jgi:hypothetical protein
VMPTGSRRRRSSKIMTAHQGEAPTSIHRWCVECQEKMDRGGFVSADEILHYLRFGLQVISVSLSCKIYQFNM